MTSLEERVSRHEGILEQMNERLGSLERGQEALRQELLGLRTEFLGLRTEFLGELRSNFRWTVGLMMGMWATVMAALVAALLTR